MKRLLIITLIIIWTNSNAQIQITKTDFEIVLQETLKKSRNAVADAKNSWRYDNTNQDYFTNDSIIINTARSYRKDYCKEIRWSFYENQKFILENTPECTEPPSMLRPNEKDYKELKCVEKNDDLYLIVSNSKGIDDKFKVLEFRRNKPLTIEESAFDYTIILLRTK
jgi:hypothetical protein